jgi:SET domain-containing protein
VDSTKRGNISRFINHCCDVLPKTQHEPPNTKAHRNIITPKTYTHIQHVTTPPYPLSPSLQPNCYTRVIKVDGWKKIVVFANR